MANHVDNYIKVTQISEEGQKVWNDIVAKLERISKDPEGRGEVHLGLMFWDDFDAEGFDRGGMCDKVGAKWAYATDWNAEEGDNFISCYSAWSPVTEFVQWIGAEIAKVDPDVMLSMEYRDEMPNFVGIAHFMADDENERYELEWDEILELCRDESTELQEWWDEDENDFKEEHEEEARDIVWELQYDVVDAWMDNFR
jgi:hypothetical protein